MIRKLKIQKSKPKSESGIIKAEELAQKCPVCGCTDKTVSRKRHPKHPEYNQKLQVAYIMNIPENPVGVISCSECNHIFEYCKEREMPIKVKKLQI